jgi:predicted secreted protein
MQRSNLKKNAIKIAIVLLNIFLIVSLLLVLVFKNDYGYSLYWVICPFLLVVVLLLINKWSVLGLNADTTDSKLIQRSFDDTTVVSTVFFGLIYLLIQGLQMWKEELSRNSFVIIGFFIVVIIYQMITYLAIYNAKKRNKSVIRKN